MKIYWSRRQIPELQSLPRRIRNRNYRDAYFRTFRHWEGWFDDLHRVDLAISSRIPFYLPTCRGRNGAFAADPGHSHDSRLYMEPDINPSDAEILSASSYTQYLSQGHSPA
ncbi:hypothetical protein [Serratia liquefaciens]|uniref:hypothetical protein n=1 Tax=Serratia TaxID=613 RepID=UPI0015624704|nr:hypothetical protein [Serratia liquefaciens]